VKGQFAESRDRKLGELETPVMSEGQLIHSTANSSC